MARETGIPITSLPGPSAAIVANAAALPASLVRSTPPSRRPKLRRRASRVRSVRSASAGNASLAGSRVPNIAQSVRRAATVRSARTTARTIVDILNQYGRRTGRVPINGAVIA